MKIKFQIFDQGLDISINNNHYSLCGDLKDLLKLKNSEKFRKVVLDNLIMPIEYEIVFENFCKNSDFQKQKDFILSWVGVA